ncbi:retropepsin-like aspartic protease [Cytophagaceae bacterium YF14B1]|uniref:Retropepsin-like aspartic protease n=1 Tax=Xanthocytophaga flava TaxID=3048013 RepID=A0AAE3QVC3_9BACT|nr:retropepsin-like aspartic protease [Xanthocytophaga flavus]MDJ1486132.1 retropepsin-like aspartic protease [Xanthocytophaga flavus]
MMRLFLHLFFAFFILALTAQNINKVTIAQRQYCDTIPFEYVNGKIIILVKIAGEDKRFILDTGAPLLISDVLQAKMRNKEVGKIKVKDITGKTNEEQLVAIDHFQIGHLDFQNTIGTVFNKDKSGPLVCYNIDGLIGSSVLNTSCIHIDADKKILILTDNIANLHREQDFRISIKLDAATRPFMSFDFGDNSSLDVLFDSGSSKCLLLSMEGYTQLSKNKKGILLNKGYGSVSSGLYGAGNAGNEFRVLVPALNFGHSTITGVIATASESKKKSSIGLGLADYGSITIDYRNKFFYFGSKSEKQLFKEASFFGFLPQYAENTFKVGVVYENTEASEKGLKPGYRILKLNDYDLSELTMTTVCEALFAYFSGQPKIILTYVTESGESKTIELENKKI